VLGDDRWRAQCLGGLLWTARGELRAERQQVALDGLEQVSAEGGRLERQRQPDRRIELVHLAVGLDPAVVLGHPLAAEQTGLAAVAGSRVDLHARNLRSAAPERERLGREDASP